MNYLPCTLNLPNVLCIAATGADGNPWRQEWWNRWYGTNYGSSTVDFAAPGAAIISTVPYGNNITGNYEEKTGTSMVGRSGALW
jgi:hypothetical protein